MDTPDSGTIKATGNVGFGIYLGSFGSYVSNAVVTNSSGGLISATGGLGYGIVISGPGSVTNLSGGTISAGDDAIAFQAGTGTIVNQGVVLATNVAAYEREGGTVTNLAGGTISGREGVWFQYEAGTFTNAGVVIGSVGGSGAVVFNDYTVANRLIVDPSASFTGGIGGGGGVVEFASGASAGSLGGFGTTITNFSSLVFDVGAEWTISGNSSTSGLGTLAISGFAANDTIDLTGFVATSRTFASNALVLTNAGGAHATLHIQSNSLITSDFQISSDLNGGTDLVICFASGTKIATPSGPVAVEALATGDAVLTHFAGVAPVQWIGRRHVDCRRHPNPAQAWPVRVKAGAFGLGRPCRDLFLSPNHAIYLAGVLIPIGRLIDGVSIVQVKMDEVTYYHLELPSHDLVMAEGVLTESYLDVGDRTNFDNNGDSVRLHPDFATMSRDAAMIWEARGCAPLIVGGPRLEAIRSLIPRLRAAPAAAATAAIGL